MEFLKENNFEDITVLFEKATETEPKRWFVEGVFTQADIVNKNLRIYPESVMDESMEKYIFEYVTQHRAVGELNHPDGLEINPERISHKIVSIDKAGKNYSGRAKISNTPLGKIVQGLLEDEIRLGVSSRAGGTTRKRSNGITEVQSPLTMRCIDIVFHPSAPDGIVKGIMEGANFISTIQEADQEFINSLREELDTDKAYKLQEARLQAFQKFMEKIIKG